MTDFFADLFRYSYLSNQQIVALFQQQPMAVSEKAHKLFSHVLNAQHIWNQRIKGEAPRFGVWEEQPFEELAALNDEVYKESLTLLPLLDEQIAYTNTKGESFVNSARDILFHVINHSTYHRAQIATECKLAGVAAPATDFIFYKR